MDRKYIDELRRLYPSELSKEQLRLICHISKRTAKRYLDCGIIPCKNNGKATHKYTIQLEDVILFLHQREADPERIKLMAYSNRKNSQNRITPIVYDRHTLSIYQRLVIDELSPYPDLMTFPMISEATGYSEKTVRQWPQRSNLYLMYDGSRHLMPKSVLTEYMISEEYRKMPQKSKKHQELLLHLRKQLRK